jgi:hypothetical protein
MSVDIYHAQRPRANDYAWCYSRTNVLIRLHKPTLWWHVYMLNTPNESWPGLYIGYGYNLLSYAYHYDISPSSLLLMLHTMLEKYSNFQISRNFNLSLSLLCHTQHTSSIHPYHYHLQAVLGWSMCRILPFHPYLLWTILTNMFSPVHNSALCLSNESCLYIMLLHGRRHRLTHTYILEYTTCHGGLSDALHITGYVSCTTGDLATIWKVTNDANLGVFSLGTQHE